MEIPFKGQLDRAVFFRAVRLANRGSGPGRTVSLLALAAVGVAIYFAVQSYLTDPVIDSANIVRLGFALLLMGIFLGFPYVLAYYQAARLWKNPAMRNLISGRAHDRGITYTNTNPFRSVSWSHFARLRLKPDLVALLTSDGVLTVFPRTFFKSEADWDKFRQLVQSKLGQPKR